MKTMDHKLFPGSMAALLGLLVAAPESFRTAATVALIFIALDTLTGTIAALACRDLRSQIMRTKLVLKLLQRMHQGLRHKPAPIRSEVPLRIRNR